MQAKENEEERRELDDEQRGKENKVQRRYAMIWFSSPDEKERKSRKERSNR